MTTTYTITHTYVALDDSTPCWDVKRGHRTIKRYFTEAEAVAKAEALNANANAQAAITDAWKAAGYRVARDASGLTRAQMYRGERGDVVILDTEGVEVARAARVADLPMPTETAEAEVEELEPEAAEVTEPARGTIADAQAEAILALIADGAHEEGGFYHGPTTRADILTMTTEDATTYLRSLTGDY